MKFTQILRPAVLVCACAVPAAHAAVVFSDDFESYLLTGGPFSGYKYFNTGDAGWGWTVGGLKPLVFDGTYQGVGGGLQSLQLEHQGDSIEQSFSTTIGAEYTLSFLLNGYSPPGTGEVAVDVTGQTTANFGPSGPPWTSHSLTFTATQSTTFLKFTNSVGYPGVNQWTQLDSIAVTQNGTTGVPEPATPLLIGAALIGLAISRRRPVS